MATVSETEFNGSSSRANALALGATVTGALSSSSDWDYFVVTVGASGVLKLDFTPPTHSSNSYFQLDVYDSAGKLLAADFVGDATSLSLGVAGAGSYYVALTTASPTSPFYSGSPYALTVSNGAGSAAAYENENNNTLATANNVTLAQTIQGQLAGSPDVDYYHVGATTGGVLVVDFKAAKTSSGNSFTVDVYDAAGNLLKEQSTAHASSLSIAVAAAGDYYVKIKQAAIYDGGNYSLTATNSTLAGLAAKPFDGSAPLTATLGAGHDWYAVNLVAGTTYEFALKGLSSGGGTLADPALTLCYANGAALESCDNLGVWSTSLNQATTSADPQIAFTAPVSGAYYLMVAGNGGSGSYTLSEKTDTSADLVQSLTDLQISPTYRWNSGSPLATPVSLTYAFLSALPAADAAAGASGFVAMTQAQKDAVRAVLDMYRSVANVTFTLSTDAAGADIRFGTSDQAGSSSGVTYTTPSGDRSLGEADVFLNNTGTASSPAATATLSPGDYGYLTLIHETGHALGLKHPGNYDAGGGGVSPPYLPPAWDSERYTVMSYLHNADSATHYSTPALLDVAAVQYLYGANTSAKAAPHTFSFSASSPFVATLLSSGSSDTVDISNQTVASTVFMTPGSYSSIGIDAAGAPARDNVAIPFGEILVGVIDGPAADLIVGNALDNSFYGFLGADTIDGGGGSNSLVLTATSASFNSATDSQFANVQTVNASTASAGVSIDAHKQSEALSLVGSAFSDSITASAGGDTISGGAGNDTLTGGSGTDTVVYSGNRAGYVTSFISSGHYAVADRLGAAGTDSLVNVDAIRYADGMQNLNIASDATSISTGQLLSLTELYIAYFNRIPEASGLDYWIKQYAAGQTLDQIGGVFYSAATSADFAALTGYSASMSNADFVTKIYQNVLGRSSPDQEGLNYWVGGLADGSQTRGTLINTMLIAAHGFKGDATYGWVADLLDNKVSVGKYNAVAAAVDYATPEEAVTKGMDIARLITPTDTSAAIQLIGLADVVPYSA